jgi:hypothetical protein
MLGVTTLSIREDIVFQQIRARLYANQAFIVFGYLYGG